ncbi:DUF6438 domain-containing protein [Aquimarina aggregata]|uniref:DUF6438 domain-containing protein n=1 Tax=Aquimarina aggregata TaxID=1642818 RepID=UPI0024916B52|nr:DUF6438 domain-containing protein [Aquimarina aggregata]
MKYLVMLLALLNFSCSSTKKTPLTSAEDDILIYYSKSPCNGKCPVYDLWIFKDGSIAYSGINNVSVKGKINKKLSKEEFESLKATLTKDPKENITFKRKRDKSITTLNINNKEYKYYTTSASNYIKELDSKLKDIVSKIMQNTASTI